MSWAPAASFIRPMKPRLRWPGAGCAKIVPMGELRLYAIEMGAILRCPSCDEAVVRIGRTPRGLWLDLRRAATVVTVSAGAP